VDTETPRPEKLVVDFDTAVNSSPTDISGKGNHGAFYNGAEYSVSDKAFKFVGVDDHLQAANSSDTVRGTHGLSGTRPVHSHSVWFKQTTDATDYTWVCAAGTATNQQQSGILISGNSGLPNRITFDNYAGWVTSTVTAELNRWYHVVATFNGGTNFNTTNCRIYVDGVDCTGPESEVVGGTATFNLQGSILALGSTHNGTRGLTGLVSNYKLYDVVLEPSEVKKLYNLGRTGRSMVISDTAVGIGKAPEAQLDVRGNLGVSGHITNGGPRLEICDDSTHVHGYGTAGKGVKCSHAGIVFDRTWSNYPCISVFTQNIDGITNQGELRIHGFDVSYSSYPGPSGAADFSVDVRTDGVYHTGSDRRMKINITTIDEALKKVCSLTGKRYQLVNRNGDINKNASQNGYNYGLIAQDVEEAGIDEIYKYNGHEDDKTENYNSAYSINYDSIIPLLINAIKEQQEEIRNIETRNSHEVAKLREQLLNENIAMRGKITNLERKTTDQELELIQLKRRLNKLESK
jgi:hypothetical protein